MRQLFVTGLHRSGTTLLEKLLHNHPQVAMASQPAPFLFYRVKQAFLALAGLQRLYPINPQFPEADYTAENFTDFIKNYPISSSEIKEIFDGMTGYEAQYSQELLPHARKLKSGSFAEVYKQICALTKLQAPKKQVVWQGTKEIIGEEFIPYFANSGVKCLLVLRDPRDMLLSTNSGKELGQVRPTLYYLQMWRKSAAFALELQQKKQALIIRYEDLVLDPAQTLAKTTDYLELAPFPEAMLQGPILSQQGTNWGGNSAFGSFRAIQTASVGRYRQHFSASQVRFTEAFCFPEMKVLGYNCDEIHIKNYTADLLLQQREPFTVTHRNFSADYSHSPENQQQEIKRLKFLTTTPPPTAAEQKEFFIFETAYRKLRETLLHK